MRDYGRVSPKFWVGQTGREIRRRGIEASVVALYLMTSPHSNMLGIYYQPILYMAHETGLGIEGASKGLQSCIEAGFCDYDEGAEMVWVYEMAKYQIAHELKPTDKRCTGIQRDYASLPTCAFIGDFFDRYKDAFHLTDRRENEGASKGHTKVHRSQEQEQEQEQEQNKTNTAAAATPPPRVRTHAREAGDESPPSPPKPEKANPLPDGPARFAVLIRRWEKERGKASRTTSSDPRLTTWAEKGITEGQLREAYDMAVADRELNGDTTAVSAGFIDVFLTKVLNPPEGESALSRAGPPGTAKPWQASWSGIVAKGGELGLQQDPDETPPEFKARVFAAVAMTEEEKSTLRADWGVQV